MILQPTPSQTPLNRVLCVITAFFGTGIALLLLNAFYEALNEYSAVVMSVLELLTFIGKTT
jgi:hypothetical protein